MDPYNPVSPLPPGLDLGEWEDVSEPAQLDLVTLRRGGDVTVLIKRQILWDVVAIRDGRIAHMILKDEELPEALARR